MKYYRQLYSIADDQITILLEKDEVDKLIQFEKKDEERKSIVENIELLQHEIAILLQKEGATKLEGLVDSQVIESSRELLQSLTEKQKKITELLTDQYQLLVKNIQNVKQQKNILKSYFGVDRKDTISLYIDQKK